MANFPILDRFRDNFENSMDTIHRYMSMDGDIGDITRWLISTDISPYSFLDFASADCFNSADAFADFLHELHHALYDDGMICFPLLGGKEPRIRFVSRFTKNIGKYIFTPTELASFKHGVRKPKITFLSGVNDFIAAREKYEQKS